MKTEEDIDFQLTAYSKDISAPPPAFKYDTEINGTSIDAPPHTIYMVIQIFKSQLIK
jgi:hypothetical protein